MNKKKYETREAHGVRQCDRQVLALLIDLHGKGRRCTRVDEMNKISMKQLMASVSVTARCLRSL